MRILFLSIGLLLISSQSSFSQLEFIPESNVRYSQHSLLAEVAKQAKKLDVGRCKVSAELKRSTRPYGSTSVDLQVNTNERDDSGNHYVIQTGSDLGVFPDLNTPTVLTYTSSQGAEVTPGERDEITKKSRRIEIVVDKDLVPQSIEVLEMESHEMKTQDDLVRSEWIPVDSPEVVSRLSCGDK